MGLTPSKLTINAISAVVQVLFTALLYFFLYKYLLNSIGVKQLGVWSLILSFSSIANLANMGLTSGLVKFVAEYLLEDDKSKIGKLILTSVCTMGVMFVIVSLVVYIGAGYFLQFIVESKFLDTAIEILPFSLISLSVNAIAGVFTSVLEGYQKNYLRNFLYILSGIFMFVLVVILTPTMKLKGVAIAQTAQAMFILVLSVIMCIMISKNNGIRFWKWNTVLFKELFNYGYKFQIVSIAQLLYEPTTKMLLSKFGGLALLGHYELANKAVSQFRALLVNANQVVVPVIAEKAKVEGGTFLKSFYIKMNRFLLLFSLPLTSILIAFTPFISLIWIKELNNDFVFSMVVLAIMTFFNVMNGPAYFSYLGEGKLNILVWVHIGIAVINIIFGFILGKFIGGYGIILAWSIAMTMGAFALILTYNKYLNINFFEIFKKQERNLLIVSLFVVSINIFSYLFFKTEAFFLKLILVFFSFIIFLPFIYNNEIVQQQISSFKRK